MLLQKQAVSQSMLARRAIWPKSLKVAAPRHAAIAPQRRSLVRAEPEKSLKDVEFDSDKLLKDLQAQWDAIENKPQVALYASGGVFGLWLTATIIGAINHVPLLPKVFEFVGLAYSTWFTYRYLLFQGSREELLKDVEELKSKITGK